MEDLLIGEGMPHGNKPAGYVGLLIAKHKLGRDVNSYVPPAKEKSMAKEFDQDKIKDPSRYIKEEMYEHSTRIRTGIKRVKETIAKKKISGFVKTFKKPPAVGEMLPNEPEDMEAFIKAYQRGGVEGVSYSSYHMTAELMFLHLMRKYKNDCIIANYVKGQYQAGVSIRLIAGNALVEGSGPDFKEAIQQCVDEKTNIIVIPLTLPGHANLMIYRPAQNTLERFEPHGGTSTHLTEKENQLVNDAIEDWFRRQVLGLQSPNILEKDLKNALKKKAKLTPKSRKATRDDVEAKIKDLEEQLKQSKAFRYLKPADLKFGLGFQSIENMELRKYEEQKKIDLTYDGFCIMWSFFYLELCLKYPNTPGKELIESAFKALQKQGGDTAFLQHILGYVEASEKALQKLIPDFAFKKYQTPKHVTSTHETWEVERVLEEYRQWYDNEMRDIMRRRRAMRGKGMECSCKGGSVECECDE